MKKALIYRIANIGGRKEYKRTKTVDYWTENKEICWWFSIQGAKRIIKTLNEHNLTNYYTYGIEYIDLP